MGSAPAEVLKDRRRVLAHRHARAGAVAHRHLDGPRRIALRPEPLVGAFVPSVEVVRPVLSVPIVARLRIVHALYERPGPSPKLAETRRVFLWRRAA